MRYIPPPPPPPECKPSVTHIRHGGDDRLIDITFVVVIASIIITALVVLIK